jgi:hypothetical protein
MPNHITNVLRVSGYTHLGAPEGLVDEVLAAVKSDKSPIDFERLIPMPAELKAPNQEGWYQWSVNHWGTKWNAYCAVAGKIDKRTAYFHFETAWAPPLPVLDALAAKFPKANLRLIWCDEGDDKQNRVYWEDGKRESDDE